MSAQTTHTVRSVDVHLGPARQTLRLTLTFDQAGNAEALVFALGFGGAKTGDPFLRPSWADAPISLPAGAIPGLRRALAELDPIGPPEG